LSFAVRCVDRKLICGSAPQEGTLMRKKLLAGFASLMLLTAALSGCIKPNITGHTPYAPDSGPVYVDPGVAPVPAPVVGVIVSDIPETALQTRDRYLLVGINAYPGCPLEGCINDTSTVAAYLKEVIGAKDTEIVVLTDEQATSANVKRWLLWLVQDARPGDKRLYHFSGHGAEFDGGGRPTVGSQPDGLNQVECTVDFDWTPEHMIQDWEFNQIFSVIPEGVLFAWISDSCHSGDLDRLVLKPGIKVRARSYPLIPPAIKARLATKRSLRALYKPAPLNLAYVAGCDYNQTSADVRDATGAYGAATHYFVAQLRLTPNASVKDNVLAARVVMRADQFDQVLQYSDKRADKPFLKP
jgi:metal-sulfur cluster biosynthetic enzyme